ncbi:MAG: UvrD-helicase domain-containing protein, partial [Methylococcaceae bacterium]
DSKEWPGLAHRLSLAADDMDEAAIFTIHGWCSRMLKQHAFDSGAAFVMEIETNGSVLLNESIRDFWRVAFYALSEAACQVVQQVVKTPDDLEQKIRTLLNTAPDTLAQLPKPASQAEAIQLLQKALDDCLEKQQAVQTIETQARDTWVTHQADIERILTQALAQKHLNGSIYRGLEKILNEFSTWAIAGTPRPASKHIQYFSSGGFRLNNAVPEEPRHEVFEQLAQFRTATSEQDTQLKQFTVSLYTQATFWVLDAFAQAKKRKSRLDYNDLIFQLNAAIKREQAGERLAAIIRQQYPVAMIDEFQDTDAAQYEIFERIYGQQSDSTAWLMIGDPKQAIYSFRGADIHAYLRAKQRSGIEHHTLSVNHRSVKALVNIVNHLFAHADKHEDGAFLFKTAIQGKVNDPIPFQSVEAKGRPEVWVRNKQPAPALTVWYLPSEQENGTVNFTRYRATLAEQAANEIARLLNESQTGQTGFMRDTQITPLQESDIAILVRDHNEAKIIRLALLRRGIRSVYMSDRDSVYETAEATEMQHCLQAFLTPQNGRAIRAALGTTLLGRTYAEIEQLSTNEAVLEEQIRLFTRYHQLWNTQGVLAAVRQFIMDQHLPARLLAQPGGERSLTNVLHLAELLQTEGVHRDGPEGLMCYFQDVCQEPENGNDEHTIRLESDDGLIRVVTLHKSKGLEYPLVFMPFVCGYKQTKDDKISHYTYHDDHGAIKLELNTETNKTSLAAMARERLQEDLRLLYVGLTRAQQACWLGTAPLVNGNYNQNTMHHGAFGYLLNGQNQINNNEVKSRLEDVLNFENVAIVEVNPEDLILAKTRRSDAKKTKTLEFNAAPYTP